MRDSVSTTPPRTIMTVTDSDNSPSKHPLASVSVPSLHCIIPYSPSFASLAHSEGDTPHYAPTLVQDPSPTASAIDLPSQSDIIIAVMGPTGAGKSTFINRAAGIEEGATEETKVGHSLESCTHQIQVVRCFDTQQKRQIVFVDTPGFDDTNLSDFDILRLIANWLKLTYEKDIRLSGLLFFHRISDNRMGGSPLKHLKMFQKLCGDEALKNVVLVTTMWGEVGEEEGSNRENELTTKYWNTMIESGSHTSRFYNDTKSALDIVSQFHDARCAVLLQKELVDMHLELAETSAARTLFSFLLDFIKKIKELITLFDAKLKGNKHSADRNTDKQEKAKTEEILRTAKGQLKQYSVPSRRRSSRSSTPVNATRQPPVLPSYLHAPNNSSNTMPCLKTSPAVRTLRASTFGSLTSSPTECSPPPPSPADATSTGQSTTRTVLQGTITALKLVQQIVGLAPIPGLQCLVGVVLTLSETVNNMYATEDALIELARKAGFLMVTLVEQGSIDAFSDSDSMNSVIGGLTGDMKRVLEVVNRISSRNSPGRFFLSDFDKAAVDECNRQLTLACGIFGIQIAFITQKAIARIEAKLNLALLKIPHDSNKQTSTVTVLRASTC